MSEGRIAAVILAAGESRRLRQPKQLIQLAGESLLRRTARLTLEAGCAPVFVVLGYDSERMCPELNGLSVEAITNGDWEEGMGSSVRCGVAAAERAGAEGVLLLVCDQPRLTAKHLRTLLARHRQAEGSITASRYEGRVGVPAVFAARLFPELLQIEGDRGARQVIERHGQAVQAVDWPEGAVDVDLPEQLRDITAE